MYLTPTMLKRTTKDARFFIFIYLLSYFFIVLNQNGNQINLLWALIYMFMGGLTIRMLPFAGEDVEKIKARRGYVLEQFTIVGTPIVLAAMAIDIVHLVHYFFSDDIFVLGVFSRACFLSFIILTGWFYNKRFDRLDVSSQYGYQTGLTNIGKDKTLFDIGFFGMIIICAGEAFFPFLS